MTRAADDVAAEIRAAGFSINNCFEIQGGMFQANLRKDSPDPAKPPFYGFALGVTMADALDSAFVKARVETGEKLRKPQKAKPDTDLADDLADLI